MNSKDFAPVILTLAAGYALIAMCIAIGLSVSNEVLRQDVAKRQEEINQGKTLSQLNSRLVASLATIAVRNEDDQIKAILASQGITFKANVRTDAPLPPGLSAQPPSNK